ncbi:MAG TPA: hypothetical protein VFI41_05460 [Gemmatimonadales bacterium]|nr:hypothetical protein [Gemmatimonadales bacterium]
MFAVKNPFEGWQPPTTAEVHRIAREESEAVLEDLAEHTRRQAATMPGWEPYADKLGVFADEGELYMGLQPGDEDEERVFDLEYGTEKSGPTALLRNSLSTHGPRLGTELAHRVTQRLANPRGGYF